MEFSHVFEPEFFFSSGEEDFNKMSFDREFREFDKDDNLLFKPFKSEKDTLMMIEEEITVDTRSASDKLHEVSSAPTEDKSKENYSKQCLKFCRKIANVIPDYLTVKDEFYLEVLKFNAGVLEGVAKNLQLDTVNIESLVVLQTHCLLKLWASFKDVMSYSKNKKICIVKEEYWGHIFDKKTSISALKEVFASLLTSSDEKVVGKHLLRDSAFSELFARMLFATNKIFVLVSILRDSTDKGTYLRGLETIDNFVLLTLAPEFFQFYNHLGGKFAVECCGRCKICRSKTMPSDFLFQLQAARQHSQAVANQIHQIFDTYISSSKFDLIVCLMRFAYDRF